MESTNTTGRLYALQLSPPAKIRVTSADGKASTTIDILEANRFMAQAEKLPEAEMASAIKQFLASKLMVAADTWSENEAFEFYEAVTGIASELKAERKKKAELTASSPVSIPASQDGCC